MCSYSVSIYLFLEYQRAGGLKLRLHRKFPQSAQLAMQHAGGARLADFLTPTQSKILSIVLEASFGCSTLLIPVVLYLIFRVKSIGKYRWYMLNGILWDYLLDILLALWRPVTFFPTIAAYSDVSCLIRSQHLSIPN